MKQPAPALSQDDSCSASDVPVIAVVEKEVLEARLEGQMHCGGEGRE